MRRPFTALALLLALVTLAAPAHGQSMVERMREAARKAAEEAARKAAEKATGQAIGTTETTASAAGAETSLLSAPRNRKPSITGVWEGTIIAPAANPNQYDFRVEISDRDGSLSGQTRKSVRGKPLQFVLNSIDGSVEDGIIRFSEVNRLKTGSSVPSCANVRHRLTLIVRESGEMVGELGYGVNCGDRARVTLRQVSTADPTAVGAAGAEGNTPITVGDAPTPPASAPAATHVIDPNVTGTWTGTITHPRGNPNRYTYRLELTQRDGVVTGTVRLDTPDQPLRFAVQNIEGAVEEGIITLRTTKTLRHGTESSWCNARRSVLMLKTDGTLTGEWQGCGGEGKVYVTKAK